MQESREVIVHVGPGLDAEGIMEALNEGGEMGDDSTLLFEVAHALLTQHSDDRAQIHSVEVTDVDIDSAFPSQVDVHFTSSWSIYVGCRDMNAAGDEHECATATYTAEGNLIFVVPVPRRPANHC